MGNVVTEDFKEWANPVKNLQGPTDHYGERRVAGPNIPPRNRGIQGINSFFLRGLMDTRGEGGLGSGHVHDNGSCRRAGQDTVFAQYRGFDIRWKPHNKEDNLRVLSHLTR